MYSSQTAENKQEVGLIIKYLWEELLTKDIVLIEDYIAIVW